MSGRLALVLLLAGALALGGGALIAPREALLALLAASLTALAWPAGCVLLGLLLSLIAGRWRALLGPGTGLGARASLGCLPLLLPLLLGAHALYPWVAEDAGGFRGFWLSTPAFVVRALLYAALWTWLALWLLPRAAQRPELAGSGLILAVLSLSAAGIDWLMSLDGEFYSTLFGLFYVWRALLLGLAFAGLTGLASGADATPLRGLLTAGVMVWGYLHFMQYLIVWSGNLPREIHWYLARGDGGWAVVSAVLFVAQGILPLLTLLFPFSARRAVLAVLCGLTLGLGPLEILWLAAPSLELAHAVWLLPLTLAALCACGGALGLLSPVWRPRHG